MPKDGSWLYKLLLVYLLVEISEGVLPTVDLDPKMTTCFKKSDPSSPNCTWGLVKTGLKENEVVSKCLDPGIAKIKGDYNVIQIRCVAPYPLEFEYDGIQPTEAILPLYGKVLGNDSGVGLQYTMEVRIFSIENLYHHHKLSSNATSRHAYSRSGKYNIFGMFKTELSTMLHIFAEETSLGHPVFIRNQRTQISFNNSRIVIPCRPTTHGSTVELVKNVSITTRFNFTPTEGFIGYPEVGQEIKGKYTCLLLDGSNEIDKIGLSFPPVARNPLVHWGFESLPEPLPNEPENLVLLNYEASNVGGTPRQHPRCSPGSQVLQPGYLQLAASIIGENEAHSKLVREFISPQYSNQSYTVRLGVQEDDFLIISQGFPPKGLIGSFCMLGTRYRVSLTAIGMNGLSGTSYPYTQEFIKVTNWELAGAALFLKARLLHPQAVTYANTLVKFHCSQHTLGIVRPIVWYSERENGTLIQELVDYDASDLLHSWEGFSILEINATKDIKSVFCTGSLWFADTWKNRSVPLALTDGESPKILEINSSTIVFKISAASQVLRCDAEGNPTPSVFWKNSVGQNLTGRNIQVLGSAILEFPKITYQHEGDYECVAENMFGRDSKMFKVIVEDGPSYGWIIAGVLSACVVIIILSLLAYNKFFGKQEGALSKKEIDEFFNGTYEYTKLAEGEVLNEDTEKYAAACAYNQSFEVDSSLFQVDLNDPIGSGEYGLVLKGILDGTSVAVKTIRSDSDVRHLKALLSELKIMMYIGEHENLIKLIGAYTKEIKKGLVYIIVPLCPLGDLQSYLRSHRGTFVFTTRYQNSMAEDNESPLTFGDLLKWAKQIASGMDYLSVKKVIHGDLAARNVLLDVDKCGKITDFGLSRKMYGYADYVKKNTEPLPWRHMSIESLRDLVFSTQTDVWAYGVTLWELFSLGETPYPGFNYNMNFLSQLEHGLRMTKPKQLTSDLHDNIILECWNLDPKKRPCFANLSKQFGKELDKYVAKLVGEPH